MKLLAKLLLLSLSVFSFHAQATKFYVIGNDDNPDVTTLRFTQSYDTHQKAEDSRKGKENPDQFKVITLREVKERTKANQTTFHAGKAGEHHAQKEKKKAKRLRKKQGGKGKTKSRSGVQHNKFRKKTGKGNSAKKKKK